MSLCKFFVCCCWFPPRLTLGFYFDIFMLISHVRREVSAHSDWLFVCKLTHEPFLGIIIVSLYCFGSPRRKFSNYSQSEQRSGHITEIATYRYPRLNYSQQPYCDRSQYLNPLIELAITNCFQRSFRVGLRVNYQSFHIKIID